MQLLPPVTKKTFKEPAYESDISQVGLDIIKLKRVPPVLKVFSEEQDEIMSSVADSDQNNLRKPLNFLLIKEKEFPNLFDDPIIKQQKMSKFFNEQDFNSDIETIELNKIDLLKQVE